MLNVEGLNEEIEALLVKRGANENVQFLLGIKNEVVNDDGSITHAEIHSMTNKECGTCAGMIVDRLCYYILEQVANGNLHVHAMPAMYKNSEAIN